MNGTTPGKAQPLRADCLAACLSTGQPFFAWSPPMSDPGSGAVPHHVSVLPAEVLSYLDVQPGQVIVDATVGGGGHTRLLAERVQPTGQIIGLDQDPRMLERARPGLAHLPVILRQANFSELATVLQQLGRAQVDGLLADLGICSDQLDDAERGFSFARPGPLDMRMNPDIGESAKELLERLSERELADLIWEYGEERFSRRIARKIVETRKREPLQTTEQLADLVRRCVPRGKRKRGEKTPIDPATRVFQALRIAVNEELTALEQLLAELPRVLKPGGRAVLISFHSLEDRRVKQEFRKKEIWEVLTRKPVMAQQEELASNPRARSAKLRAARRRGWTEETTLER